MRCIWIDSNRKSPYPNYSDKYMDQNPGISLSVPAKERYWITSLNMYESKFGLGAHFEGKCILQCISWGDSLTLYINEESGQIKSLLLGMGTVFVHTWKYRPNQSYTICAFLRWPQGGANDAEALPRQNNNPHILPVKSRILGVIIVDVKKNTMWLP